MKMRSVGKWLAVYSQAAVGCRPTPRTAVWRSAGRKWKSADRCAPRTWRPRRRSAPPGTHRSAPPWSDCHVHTWEGKQKAGLGLRKHRAPKASRGCLPDRRSHPPNNKVVGGACYRVGTRGGEASVQQHVEPLKYRKRVFFHSWKIHVQKVQLHLCGSSQN